MHSVGRTQAVSRRGNRHLQHSSSFHTGCLVGRRTTLSLVFIPNLCCRPEQVEEGSKKGLAQQGMGFGAVLGQGSPPGFSWASILLKRCGGASPQCVTLASLGCISKAASAPWFALLRSLGSLIRNTRRCLSSSGSPCASVSTNPACSCTSHVFLSQSF